MISTRPWYYDYVIKYGIRNEYGELLGISDEVPPEVKKAFEEDRAKEEEMRKKCEAEGYILS